MATINGCIAELLDDPWFRYKDSLGVENVIRSSEVESFKQESLNGDVTIIRTKSGNTHRVKGRFGTDEKMVHIPTVFGTSNREGPMPEVVVSNVEEDPAFINRVKNVLLHHAPEITNLLQDIKSHNERGAQ